MCRTKYDGGGIDEGPGHTGDKLTGGLWHRGINSYKVYHWEWLGRYYVTVSSDGQR